MDNYYKWLDDYLPIVFLNLELEQYVPYCESIIISDADKCYGYESIWNKSNIPFEHGSALYLISKLPPYHEEVRDTPNGWISPDKWVINNYDRFKEYLPEIK